MRIALITIFFFLAWAGACAEAEPAPYILQLEFAPSPPTVGDARVQVHATHDGLPAAGLQVTLEADMPSMPAMRASRAVLAPTRPGDFGGTVVLSMSGTWRVRVRAQGPSGQSETTRTVSVVDAPAGSGESPPSPITSAPSSTDAAPSPSMASEPAATRSPSTASESPAPSAANPPPPGATVTVRPTAPLHVGSNVLVIDVRDAAGQPLDAVDVWSGLSMPGMFMHVPPRKASPSAPGRYERTVRLPMAGQWTLTVDVERAVGRQADANGRLATERVAHHRQSLVVGGPSSSPSRLPTIGLVGVGAALTLFAGWRAPRRSRAATVLGCALCVIAALAVGEALRAHAPQQETMGMEMDMAAPDMGLAAADLAAPIPVLVEPVRRHAVIATTAATATVAPAPQRGQLRLSTAISVRDRARLQPGAEIIVRPQDSRAPMPGHVVAAAEDVDAATQTVAVEALVPDPEGRLRVGQTVPITLQLARRDNVLAIPATALYSDRGQPAVWRVREIAGQRIATRQFVEIGLTSPDQVEIRSGLVDNDEVATWGIEDLQDGASVTPATRGGGPYHNLLTPSE